MLNVVPVTYADCDFDIQVAVDKAIETLRSSVIKFNEASKRLLLETVKGTSEHEVLADYIQVLQTNQTGHHYWRCVNFDPFVGETFFQLILSSLRSVRYLLNETIQTDGSLEITL